MAALTVTTSRWCRSPEDPPPRRWGPAARRRRCCAPSGSCCSTRLGQRARRRSCCPRLLGVRAQLGRCACARPRAASTCAAARCRGRARAKGVEAHVGDLHELVAWLSLNGREWGGARRGRGCSARGWAPRSPSRTRRATSAASAARAVGVRPGVAEGAPCFCSYQAALMAAHRRRLAPRRVARIGRGLVPVDRVCQPDVPAQRRRGQRRRAAADGPALLPRRLQRRLRGQPRAAAAVKVLLVHTENSRDWTYERAMELPPARQGGAAGVQTAVGNRGTQVDEFKM